MNNEQEMTMRINMIKREGQKIQFLLKRMEASSDHSAQKIEKLHKAVSSFGSALFHLERVQLGYPTNREAGYSVTL